jgi:hypothetical protein
MDDVQNWIVMQYVYVRAISVVELHFLNAELYVFMPSYFQTLQFFLRHCQYIDDYCFLRCDA